MVYSLSQDKNYRKIAPFLYDQRSKNKATGTGDQTATIIK